MLRHNFSTVHFSVYSSCTKKVKCAIPNEECRQSALLPV